MKNYKPFSVFLIILLLASCLKEQKNNKKHPEVIKSEDIYKDTKLTDFWVMDANAKSDTIIIMNAGGPKWELDILSKGKTIYRYVPNYKNYGFVYVHQAQTIDNRIQNQSRILTLEEAKEETNNNTEILHKTITYFKELGKYVVVVGKSHGAYVIQEYLASKEAKADKYFLVAGRLKMNEEMTQQQLRGFNGEFSDDGLTYLPEDENSNLSEYSEKEINLYKQKQMLKAGYGSKDYIKKLKNVDLSNVTYLYGTKDRNIGRLTEKEIAFLASKNVRLIKEATDHSGMTRFFIDKLTDGTIEF